jgi:hypothetical protein
MSQIVTSITSSDIEEVNSQTQTSGHLPQRQNTKKEKGGNETMTPKELQAK